MDLCQLITLLCGALQKEDPQTYVKKLLQGYSKDYKAVFNLLSSYPETSNTPEQAFLRTPDLTLLKVTVEPGRKSPPHNHHSWACMLILQGNEKNCFYQKDETGKLALAEEKIVSPGDVLALPDDVIHSIENVAEEPVIALHVYGTDILQQTREMFDPKDLQEYPFEENQYAEFTRAISS